MRLNKIIKRYFNVGNVAVCGLRGRGKDVLFGNVIARKNRMYISNLNYGYCHIPFDYRDIDCGCNTYKQFLEGNLNHYEFKYPYDTDIYISDAGIMFPAHEHKNLEKQYPYLPTYMALSRQVSHNNFHFNVQNLNRVWDKIREQCDIYIKCVGCKVICGIVFMRIRVYEYADSCTKDIKPCPIRPKGLNKDRRLQAKIYYDNYSATYGNIKEYSLIFLNRSCHDTYHFEKVLKNA